MELWSCCGAGSDPLLWPDPVHQLPARQEAPWMPSASRAIPCSSAPSLDPSSWIWQCFPAWLTGSSTQHLPHLLAWGARVATALHTIMQRLSTVNSPTLGTGESHWTTGSIKSASPLEKHHKKPPTGLCCSCSFGSETNFLSKWTFSDRKRCLCPSHCLQNICTCCRCSRVGSIPPACACDGRKSLSRQGEPFHKHSPLYPCTELTQPGTYKHKGHTCPAHDLISAAM